MAGSRFKIYVSGKLDKESFSFNNILLRSPLRYKMMERRFLYFLAEEIKKRYDKMGLSVRENWENLCFDVDIKELAVLGGNTNIKRTNVILVHLARRGVLQYSLTEDNNLLVDYYHWIDAIRLNSGKKSYRIRVSPELFDYVVNLTKNFTILDLHTALLLDSKYSQKFYEILTMYSTLYVGKNRFKDLENLDSKNVFKERVFKMPYSVFRYMFGLSEMLDPLTGEVLDKEKFLKFAQVENKVIKVAQDELYQKYKDNLCDVWFDYEVGDREGGRKNGTPQNLFFYIYTREHPKSQDASLDHPYYDGDAEPLYPYEELKDGKKLKTYRVRQTDWLRYDFNWQRTQISSVLMGYFKGDEYDYYMSVIDTEQSQNSDSYSQVLQVLFEKSRQPKFISQTAAYKKTAVRDYVLQKNLKAKFGWSIPPLSPRVMFEKH